MTLIPSATTGNAYLSRHLVPSLCLTYLCSKCWDQFSRPYRFFSVLFHLEYPSVLSGFRILATLILNHISKVVVYIILLKMCLIAMIAYCPLKDFSICISTSSQLLSLTCYRMEYVLICMRINCYTPVYSVQREFQMDFLALLLSHFYVQLLPICPPSYRDPPPCLHWGCKIYNLDTPMNFWQSTPTESLS